MTYPNLRRILCLTATLTSAGCGLSDHMIEMALDAGIEEVIDEVDAPEPSQTELKLLALDVKDLLLDLLYAASRTVTDVQREFERPSPNIVPATRAVEAFIDEVDRLPVPTLLARVRAWYERQSPAVQSRLWAKLHKDDDDDDRGKKWEQERTKRNAEFLDALALDVTQRARADALIARDRAEQEAAEAERQRIVADLKRAWAMDEPDVAVFEYLERLWATIDTDAIRRALDRWVTFYALLRPAQQRVVHAYIADTLDDIPRLSGRHRGP